jgi:hypothetical protein
MPFPNACAFPPAGESFRTRVLAEPALEGTVKRRRNGAR